MKLILNKIIKLGYKHIELGNYPGAIKIFYKILKSNPNAKLRINALIGLGDALRAEYEIESADEIYKKALLLAENLEDIQLIEFLDEKIKNIYVFKKEREINPIQIGIFMRGLMKLLSFLGKTDWF